MKTIRRSIVLAVVTAVLLWAGARALAQAQATAAGAGKDTRVEAIPGPETALTLAAAGDAIHNRRLMPFDNDKDPRFQDMVRIIRGADAAFLNLEQSLFRMSEFKGWPEVENGGNWEVGPPEIALDLKAMGFDLFNRANNHTTDYGAEGMRVTNQWLDEVGIVHAGTGMNLGQASRPGYLDTPRGRVALIGLATTFTPMSRAGAARPEVPGRPGLNGLRIDRRYQLDAASFASLRSVAGKLGVRVSENTGAPLRLFGTTVEPGSESRVVETLNQADEERIIGEVRNASRLADYVIVSSHSHEPGNDSVEPPAWMVAFAHRCIDEGASIFFIHGPHQLRGVEIYKGRPILYSLGNFVFQNETIDPMPFDHYEQYGLPNTALASDLYDARFKGGTTGFPSSPVWYQSVIAVPTFKGGRMTDLKMYPIDLQQKAPRSQRGSPRLAGGATAREIIDRLTRMSAALGTTLANENGVLVWRPTAAAPQQ